MTRIFSLFSLSPLFNLDGFSSGLMKGGARLFLLASLIVLAACSEDKDFNTDKRSADFTAQNFGASALGVVQAALLAPAHIPFFNVLSESALPDRSVRIQNEGRNENERIYQLSCAEGGTARFTFNSVSGSAHPVGNKVKIEYRNCDHGETPTYVGDAEFTYTKFEGLAKRLETNSTEECAAAIAQDYASEQGQTLDTINIYYVSGLELIFTPSGGDRQVQVRRIEPNLQGIDEEVVEDVRIIEQDEVAIIVLQDSAESNADKLTDDGDVIYFVKDSKEQLQLCQSMYRTLSAKLTDFGIVRDDFSAYMNGTVTLVNTTEDFVSYSGRIADDSDYAVRVEQGVVSEVYDFEDISVIRNYSSQHGNFSYKIAGHISFEGVGKALMSTDNVFFGNESEPFVRSGLMRVYGIGEDFFSLEALDGNFVKVEASLVEAGGDTSASLLIRTSWEELMARDFEYTED